MYVCGPVAAVNHSSLLSDLTSSLGVAAAAAYHPWISPYHPYHNGAAAAAAAAAMAAAQLVSHLSLSVCLSVSLCVCGGGVISAARKLSRAIILNDVAYVAQ